MSCFDIFVLDKKNRDPIHFQGKLCAIFNLPQLLHSNLNTISQRGAVGVRRPGDDQEGGQGGQNGRGRLPAAHAGPSLVVSVLAEAALSRRRLLYLLLSILFIFSPLSSILKSFLRTKSHFFWPNIVFFFSAHLYPYRIRTKLTFFSLFSLITLFPCIAVSSPPILPCLQLSVLINISCSFDTRQDEEEEEKCSHYRLLPMDE